MSEGSIEILGQKLAYPTSRHGTAAVLAVCVSLVFIASFAKDWATPEVLDKLKGIASYSEEQDKTTKELVETVAKLTLQLNELEGKVSKGAAKGSNAAESKEFKIGQIQRQIELSKLRERFATQNLLRHATISPLVNSETDLLQQVQQLQRQQSQQQQIQEDLTLKLEQLQDGP
jgi:hypothetical protein